jgi:hypothetical protein
MKNLLYNWSGRLLALLLPAAMAASIFVPAKAMAVVFMSMGGGDNSSMEGDPLDTNDYGGGGGGSDIHNSGAGGSPIPLVLEFGDIQIFMVTEVVGGKVVFRILVVERVEKDLAERSVKGTHAQ